MELAQVSLVLSESKLVASLELAVVIGFFLYGIVG
jgi:hypothetical protein